MKRALTFVRAVSRHWGSLVTGGVFIGLLGTWQLTGHAIHPWLGWAIALVAVIIACFNTWNDQQDVIDRQREPEWLLIMQKEDPGYSEVRRRTFPGPTLLVTMLVANRSNRPNSVVRYEASATKKDGTTQQLKVEQGKGTESTDAHDELVLYSFGVTPLNIAPCTTEEAIFEFLDFNQDDYGDPIHVLITALDMYGNLSAGTALVSNPQKLMSAPTRP